MVYLIIVMIEKFKNIGNFTIIKNRKYVTKVCTFL